MSQYNFQILTVRDSTAKEWLRAWGGLDAWSDDDEYAYLISRHEALSSGDFARIGKWKDGVKTARQWKANVASVAYLIWMQAAAEKPKRPGKVAVACFLDDWSSRTYTDVFLSKSVVKSFGLARASTLLHFVSGGHYPIFDARVRTAIVRLRNVAVDNTVRWYLDSFCPYFSELAALCETGTELHHLDKALFNYGAFGKPSFLAGEGCGSK
jgi:hypothetical protein